MTYRNIRNIEEVTDAAVLFNRLFPKGKVCIEALKEYTGSPSYLMINYLKDSDIATTTRDSYIKKHPDAVAACVAGVADLEACYKYYNIFFITKYGVLLKRSFIARQYHRAMLKLFVERFNEENPNG